jgi:hypothetical protein
MVEGNESLGGQAAQAEGEVWAVHMVHADIKGALLEDQDVAEYLQGKASGFKTKAWDRMWQDMDAPLLETAARAGYPLTLAVLVGLGAGKTAKKQGRLEAALMMAMKARCAESAKILVKAGADGEAKMMVKAGNAAEMASALDLARRQELADVEKAILDSSRKAAAKQAKADLGKTKTVAVPEALSSGRKVYKRARRSVSD